MSMISGMLELVHVVTIQLTKTLLIKYLVKYLVIIIILHRASSPKPLVCVSNEAMHVLTFSIWRRVNKSTSTQLPLENTTNPQLLLPCGTRNTLTKLARDQRKISGNEY